MSVKQEVEALKGILQRLVPMAPLDEVLKMKYFIATSNIKDGLYKLNELLKEKQKEGK